MSLTGKRMIVQKTWAISVNQFSIYLGRFYVTIATMCW